MDLAPSSDHICADLTALGLSADASSRRRTEYAYDASNYRLRPLVVVFPRSAAEVAAVAAYCHRKGLTLTARGGGTGMGGNAIGNGVILDFSRHLNRTLAVDARQRTAVAQAGIVLTTLQGEVRAATGGSLTFAPDPSSQSRATLGGAIANDACGNHSVRHGRTTDHVESLDLVTADGLQLTATRTGLIATDPDDAIAAGRAEAHRHDAGQMPAGRPERDGLALAALEAGGFQPARDGAAGGLVRLLRQAIEHESLGQRQHQGAGPGEDGLDEEDVGHWRFHLWGRRDGEDGSGPPGGYHGAADAPWHPARWTWRRRK